MKQTVETTPQVTSTTSTKRLYNFKKSLKIITPALIISLLIAGGYYLLSQKDIVPKVPLAPQTSQTTLDKVVTKVGDESLYQRDLNQYLVSYFPSDPTKKQAALEMMIDDSIILQEAKKSGFISLNSTVYNSPNKNVASRSALIELSKNKLSAKNVSKISGEIVSLWFNNTTSYPIPKIGIKQAQKVVKAKIDAIHKDLKSGLINMQQAGQRIKKDTSMAEIDPSHKGNAYSKFTELGRNNVIFKDPKVNDFVWTLTNGELSDVLLVRDFKLDKSSFDAYYSIVKISSLDQGFVDIDKYLAGVRKNYEIIRY